MKLKFNFGFIYAETYWIKYLNECQGKKRNFHDNREALLDEMDIVNNTREYDVFAEKTTLELEFKKL